MEGQNRSVESCVEVGWCDCDCAILTKAFVYFKFAFSNDFLWKQIDSALFSSTLKIFNPHSQIEDNKEYDKCPITANIL